MKDNEVMEMINKIFNSVFSCNNNNNNSLEDIISKFAFDIKLPRKVFDKFTNEETYTDFNSGDSFITKDNMEKLDASKGFMLDKRNFSNLDDLLSIWNNINYLTTERNYNSSFISKSDTIYDSSYVYNCSNCSKCQYIAFCDGCGNCEYLLASQRTGNSTFSIRVDDSTNCSNCYSVICSNKISNSLFIQDCFDLDECIFCSHIASKKYCICNMQFDKDEYYYLKKKIIEWIVNS